MKPLYQEIKSVVGLSLSLAKANFKVRNEGSFLGIFWYLLEPLSFFVILFFISETISQNSIAQYPLYLFIGLIMFNFFNAVTSFSTKVISNNAGFIKSLKIRSEAFVLAGVWQFVFSHIFELIALIIFAIILQANLGWFVFYFIILLFFILFTTGVSLILSVVGVYIGDLHNVWNVFSRLLWFATPIFYVANTQSLIGKINIFNPLYYFIHTTREVVIYQRIPSMATLITIVFGSIVMFAIGLFVFEKFKNSLAEKL
jgi:lipopolysaccharide transport system permease protein